MSDFNVRDGAFLGENSVGKESQVLPRFYIHQKYQPAIEGVRPEPVSVPVEMVEIRQATEKDNIHIAVTDAERRRWPTQYAAFKQGREQAMSGTPIEHLYPAMPEIISELKRLNVHTVEALANAPDSSGAIIPFLTDRKKHAKAYLEKHTKAAGFDEVARENEELKKRLEALEAMMTEKRGPGRPRKLEEAA